MERARYRVLVSEAMASSFRTLRRLRLGREHRPGTAERAKHVTGGAPDRLSSLSVPSLVLLSHLTQFSTTTCNQWPRASANKSRPRLSTSASRRRRRPKRRRPSRTAPLRPSRVPRPSLSRSSTVHTSESRSRYGRARRKTCRGGGNSIQSRSAPEWDSTLSTRCTRAIMSCSAWAYAYVVLIRV